MLKNILLSFIPLFVAVDAIGVLPIFVSLTEPLEQKERTKVIIQSMLTASGLAMGFVLVGKLVFKFLGIAMGDFMIAGGAILFCLAIVDIVNPVKKVHPRPGPWRGAARNAADSGAGGFDDFDGHHIPLWPCTHGHFYSGQYIACRSAFQAVFRTDALSWRGRLKSLVKDNQSFTGCNRRNVDKKRAGAVPVGASKMWRFLHTLATEPVLHIAGIRLHLPAAV